MNEQKRISDRRWARRGLALAVAAGTGLGTLAIGAGSAQANSTTRTVAADGQSISFTTSDSSRNVLGDIELVVNSDGNWSIDADAYNSHAAYRKVHWTCDIVWGAAEVTHGTATKKVRRKSSATLTAGAFDANLKNGFEDIVESGSADCDIVIG